jgi:hypothetical protein
MRSLKVLAIVGLAVMGMFISVQAQQKSNLAGITVQDIDVFFRPKFVASHVLQLDAVRYKPINTPGGAIAFSICFTKSPNIDDVWWLDNQGQLIRRFEGSAAIKEALRSAKCLGVDFRIGTDNSIAVRADQKLVGLGRFPVPFNAYGIHFFWLDKETIDDIRWLDKDGNDIGPASLEPVPTLTEWGLIALAVLLAGSLAFMIRRRLAPRPAGA